jgi:crotonobetainyl-CoA:carnitine CoA-transferase CaiB-like acyl-CoA transferase
LRVLELTTTIAGPYCGMILGTLGVDVVKVERPGVGDDARALPPRLRDDSSVFDAVNAGKRSLVLDLREPAGRDALLRLATSADVVVQNFRPGTAQALGVGYDDVRARHQAIVDCSISAFGSSGSGAALPGYDPIVQAFCGLISLTGEPEGAPVRVAASLIDLTSGMWAAMGIIAALQRRSRTGDGEHVEGALVDSGFALLCNQILGMHATGLVPERLGSASPITAPVRVLPDTGQLDHDRRRQRSRVPPALRRSRTDRRGRRPTVRERGSAGAEPRRPPRPPREACITTVDDGMHRPPGAAGSASVTRARPAPGGGPPADQGARADSS